VYDFSLVHREDTLYVLLYDQNFSPNLFSAPLGGQPFSPESLAARFVQERLTHTFIDLRILADLSGYDYRSVVAQRHLRSG